MEHSDLTALFGWLTIINMSLLVMATLVLTLFREPVIKLHSGMLGLAEPELRQLYSNYLSHYKILILVFNLSPYIALRVMV